MERILLQAKQFEARLKKLQKEANNFYTDHKLTETKQYPLFEQNGSLDFLKLTEESILSPSDCEFKWNIKGDFGGNTVIKSGQFDS